MADTAIAVARKDATQALSTSWQEVTLPVDELLEGSITKPTTARFRVPTAGMYEVSYFLAFTMAASDADWELLGRVFNVTRNAQVPQSFANAGQNDAATPHGLAHKFYVKLRANDDIALEARYVGTATVTLTGAAESYTSLSIRFVGESIEKLEGSASATGQGTVTETYLRRRRVSESLSGQGTVAGTAGALKVAANPQTTIELTATAITDLAVPDTFSPGGTLPGISKKFYGNVDELEPAESSIVGMVSNPAVNNKLSVQTSSNLELSGTYTGPAYTLAGPADTSSSPVKLGFKKGDKIRLKGPVGGELNDGKELTLEDPATFTVMETLATPDATLYDFTVLRRNL